ncbi:hypothetical protein PtA15_11A102, partial [Puccinia triticina]
MWVGQKQTCMQDSVRNQHLTTFLHNHPRNSPQHTPNIQNPSYSLPPRAYGPSPPPNRPSGAPDAIMDDMDLADGSTTRLPAKPDNEPPPSVLLAYLENFIANPSNRSPQGEVIVDPNSLGAILVMMNAESTRLKEMNRQMNQMSRMVETFNARLKALESGNAP